LVQLHLAPQNPKTPIQFLKIKIYNVINHVSFFSN